MPVKVETELRVLSTTMRPARRPPRMHPHMYLSNHWTVTYIKWSHRCKWVGPWDAMPEEIRKAVQIYIAAV